MTKDHQHRIRSFVRRLGRMTLAQKKALIDLWPQYGLDYTGELLNFKNIFHNDHPIILEIGFGNGASLAELAVMHPENNYLGIEVHLPGVGHLLSLIEQQQIHNIRIFQHDAIDIIKHSIPDNALDGINIYFPDPWPKARHHKRRLIQSEFINLITTKLKVAGKLHLATDWENYAEQMMNVMSARDDFINLAGHGHFIENKALRPHTKFEKRGLKLGHGVWDLMLVKK